MAIRQLYQLVVLVRPDVSVRSAAVHVSFRESAAAGYGAGMTWRALLGTCVLVAAVSCVGDSPGPGGGPSQGLGDGGTDTADPTEAGAPVGTRLDLVLEPTSVVRGQAGSLRVGLRWTGTPKPAIVSLEVPTQLEPGNPVTLDAAATETNLQFSAKGEAPYQSVEVSVLARSADPAAELLARATVQVSIRGPRGALDTTYGLAGEVQFDPQNGRLADAALADNGELFVAGDTGDMRRYDADGVLDPAFSEFCTAPTSDHIVYRHAIQVGPGATWQMMIHHADADFDLFGRCSAAAAPSLAVTNEHSTASSYENENSLRGLIGLGPSSMIALQRVQGNTITAKLIALDASTTPITAWGKEGKLEMLPSSGQQPYDIVDFQSSPTRIYVLGTAAITGSNGWDVTVIRRQDGGIAKRVPVGSGPPDTRSLSRPNAAGTVMLVKSTPRACLLDIGPEGEAGPSPTCFAHPSDERSVQGVFLRDGRRAIVALGSTSTLWTYDAQGAPEAPFDGIDLQLPAAGYQLQQLFEDAAGRLILAADGPAMQAEREWLIRRIWL